MPRADHFAVMLPVEGGAAEVNEPHLGVLHLPHVLPLQGKRSDLFVSFQSSGKLRVNIPASVSLEAWQNDFNEAVGYMHLSVLPFLHCKRSPSQMSKTEYSQASSQCA